MNLFRRIRKKKEKRKVFTYKSVPNTGVGIKEAERLQAIGWKIIVTGLTSFLMESPTKRK